MRSSRGGGNLAASFLGSQRIEQISKKCYNSDIKHHYYSKAFTLAEVLITLGIIGIVAALTLPSLIMNHKNKELIVATKKTYSVVENALIMAQGDFGTIGDNTSLFDTSQTSLDLAKSLQKYFKGAVLCENKSTKGCAKYYDITYKYAKKQLSDGSTIGSNLNYLPKLILTDGVILSPVQQKACHNTWYSCKKDEYGYCEKDENGNEIMVQGGDDACGYIYFDVNGNKLPNQYGRDAYSLKIREKDLTGIYYDPVGAQSLKNILSGKDELIYEDYKIGEPVE